MQREWRDANEFEALMPLALTLQMRNEDLGLVVNFDPIGRLGAGSVRRHCVNFRLGFLCFVAVCTFTGSSDVNVIVDLWDY